ncbi:MAG TPA: S53 family peptidase, partial [Terriglobia bacterium]|nr:S53 family peptidase [Terriglobia bacterium]
TVQQMCDAFKVDLARYEYLGRTYRCRTGAIYVPAQLAGIVTAVLGFDNSPAARPHYRVAQAAAVSYTPVQVAQLYKFPANLNGSGEAIAIIELGGGYNPADLKAYFSQLGIAPAPSVSAVSVGGASNSPTGDPNGPDAEVMLDIEVSGSVAPGASIVVYFADNTSAGFLNAINTAIHDTQHKPSVVSISWGGPESSWAAQDQTAFNNAFQSAGALGITICIASGDGGSSDGVSDGLAHVDFPSSSPYALACGGTSLSASGGGIAKEVVWDDQPDDGAGGGGVSAVFPLPSWQAKADVPVSVNPGSFRGRGVPDVAGDADPNTGYQVRVDGSNAVIGGTSAVAPLWAGLIACLNQGLGRPVGYLNPSLYGQVSSHAGALRDITAGTNGSYKAAAGWDACTGWGSPDGGVLLSALGATGSQVA